MHSTGARASFATAVNYSRKMFYKFGRGGKNSPEEKIFYDENLSLMKKKVSSINRFNFFLVIKKLSKNHQKIIKKLSKNYQKIIKKLSKNSNFKIICRLRSKNNLPKSCFCYIKFNFSKIGIF